MDKQAQPLLIPSENEDVKTLLRTVIDQKYKIVTKLNSPSIYFEVYLASVIGTTEQVAVKVEKIKGNTLTLNNEYRALRTIQSNEKRCEGIPKSYWFGIEDDSNILVQELLGPHLDSLLRTCMKNFSLKTILMLGEQMLRRLEFLHGAGYVHRDVKPQNFAIGLLDKSSMVYLANLGNAKQFKNSKTGAHKPYSENKQMIGTSNFSSVNSHLGIEPTRRDDLESLAYVLVYLYKGILPWQNIHSNSSLEKMRKVMESKMMIPAELLCRGMPDAFAMFLTYCKELKYDERPDYRYLKELLREAAAQNNIAFDNNYDWMITSKLIEQNSKYQFRHMSISFRSPVGQSQMTRSVNNQTLLTSVEAPKFKFSRSMVGEDVLVLDDDPDPDNIIPHDLGISNLSDDSQLSGRRLLTQVVRSNSEPYKNSCPLSVRNYASDETQTDKPLLQEKPLFLQKLMSVPLPVVNDLEEDKDIIDPGVDAECMNKLEFKSNTMDSLMRMKSNSVGTPYNIILTQSNGNNYEFSSKNGRVSKTLTGKSLNHAPTTTIEEVLLAQEAKQANKVVEMGSFAEDEENTKELSKRSLSNEEDDEADADAGEEQGQGQGQGQGQEDEESSKDKDDKNCQIF